MKHSLGCRLAPLSVKKWTAKQMCALMAHADKPPAVQGGMPHLQAALSYLRVLAYMTTCKPLVAVSSCCC